MVHTLCAPFWAITQLLAPKWTLTERPHVAKTASKWASNHFLMVWTDVLQPKVLQNMKTANDEHHNCIWSIDSTICAVEHTDIETHATMA